MKVMQGKSRMTFDPPLVIDGWKLHSLTVDLESPSGRTDPDEVVNVRVYADGTIKVGK